ncbi:MAG: diaminopimelate decarboxylase [Candidatus Omnitrophica bacterium]|nr:diaminopimelate decarboxylase [Candidatus Omnitrophota bacterium]
MPEVYYPHDFRPQQGRLYCESVPVAEIAKAVGTPVYIYSYRTLVGHLQKLRQAFKSLKPLICFSVKANGNLAILRLLVRQGAGLDIVSGGELYKALKVECPSERIVFASVGKSPEEIRQALAEDIFCFNVESEAELLAIEEIAQKAHCVARVALRINPDVAAHTHRHITTGIAESKFGIDRKKAAQLLRQSSAFRNTQIIGLHVHIGSQVTQAAPFIKALKRLEDLFELRRRLGLPLEWLNLGGGLGIIYKNEQPQTPRQFASVIVPLINRLQARLILEPGRFIVGNAGILVAKVLYVKQARGKRFAVIDAGMNDLIRPALYDAYHGVVPVQAGLQDGTAVYDIVGPICESADVFARKRRLERLQPNDFLAVLGAGAYGSTMASNYNGRLRPAEVLVRGSRWALIRKREDLRDLIRHDVIPNQLLK